MVHLTLEHLTSKLVVQREGLLYLLKPRNGGFKVSLGGESVGTNRSQVRELEVSVEDLADVAPGGLGDFDSKLDAARDDQHVFGRDHQLAELGDHVESAYLRNHQEVAVGVVECLVVHRGVAAVLVDTHPRLVDRAADAHVCDQALDPGDLLLSSRESNRHPPVLVRIQHIALWAVELVVHMLELLWITWLERFMGH